MTKSKFIDPDFILQTILFLSAMLWPERILRQQQQQQQGAAARAAAATAVAAAVAAGGRCRGR